MRSHREPNRSRNFLFGINFNVYISHHANFFAEGLNVNHQQMIVDSSQDCRHLL